MSDIILPSHPHAITEEEVRQGIELLFFAYRDFTAEPDAILARYGFGRAHHRVIHFVGRHPQMTVGELLAILRITKQSLSRVLGQLVRQKFILQHPGPQDRRQRLLELTRKGRDLERKLSEPQRARIANAYRQAGPRAEGGIPGLWLTAMAEPEDRVNGLEQGADDYLSKPFGPRELVLRIRNLLQRRPATDVISKDIRLGGCRFDIVRGELYRGGDVV